MTSPSSTTTTTTTTAGVIIATIIVLVGAVIVSVVTAIQAMNLRSVSRSLRSQVYGAHFRATDYGYGNNTDASSRIRSLAADGGGEDSGRGAVRAYALVLYAQRSVELNAEYPDAVFRAQELRTCRESPTMLDLIDVVYARPHWLLFQRARGADLFVQDVRDGRVTHVGLSGWPCRVRLPEAEELEAISRTVPDVVSPHRKASSTLPSNSGVYAVLFAATTEARDVEGSGRSLKCGAQDSALFAFRQAGDGPGDGEAWASLVSRLALREHARANSSTSAHLWGYSTV
jgi:hypothetical protein